MDSGKRAIKAAVFDLDDTLYPEWQYVFSGYRAAAGYLRKELGRSEPPGADCAFDQWLLRRFLAGERASAFDSLNEHYSLGLSVAEIMQLVEAYRNHRPSVCLYDGAADLLGRLHERFRLAVLTDGFMPAQRLKMEALGAGRFFDLVLFTEELGRQYWKPSTKGFEMIQESFGLPGESCAYVADNPAKDFVAPNSLGWLTIRQLRPRQLYAGNQPAPCGLPKMVVREQDQLLAALTGLDMPTAGRAALGREFG